MSQPIDDPSGGSPTLDFSELPIKRSAPQDAVYATPVSSQKSAKSSPHDRPSSRRQVLSQTHTNVTPNQHSDTLVDNASGSCRRSTDNNNNNKPVRSSTRLSQQNGGTTVSRGVMSPSLRELVSPMISKPYQRRHTSKSAQSTAPVSAPVNNAVVDLVDNSTALDSDNNTLTTP